MNGATLESKAEIERLTDIMETANRNYENALKKGV
jgi:hypothetical protein